MKKTNFDSYISREVRINPELNNELSRAGVAIDISMQIYELRKSLGMTQKELAKMTGVKQSNIARLERADYEGYSLKTLNKVAIALKTKLKITLTSEEKEPKVFYKYIIHFFNSPIYVIKTDILRDKANYILPIDPTNQGHKENEGKVESSFFRGWL